MLRELAELNNTVIIALTESHLRKEIRTAEVHMKGFHLYRADRTEGFLKGGVAVYVREELVGEIRLLNSNSNDEVEWVTLYFEKKKVVFSCVYRPPTCGTPKFDEYIGQLNDNIETLGQPVPTIAICGDFNFPIIDWSDGGSMRGGAEYTRTQAHNLMEWANDFFLEQKVLVNTRVNNILDLLFTNNGELFTEIDVRDTVLSDHRLIIAGTILDWQLDSGEIVREPVVGESTKLSDLNFNHDSIDWTRINDKLSAVRWESGGAAAGVNELYESLCSHILQICCDEVPLKRRKTIKGIPRDRKLYMRKITNLRKKMKKVTTQQAKNHCITQMTVLEDKIRLSHLEERQREEQRAVECIRENPKYFYTYARSKSALRVKIGPLKKNGVLYGDPKDIAEILSDQYQSAFSSPATNLSIASIPDDGLSDVEFGEEDVVESIKNLSATSAAGPDDIPAVLFKKCPALITPITGMWKKSLDSGEIPEGLKLGMITPIYKEGTRGDAKNYRPVALTSHLIKVFERVLTRKISEYLCDRDLFNDGQHGFRKNRSCLSQLLEHQQHILDVLENGNVADVVYLDFAKAFDKVDHGILLNKMRTLGFGGKLLAWVAKFLMRRKQCVVVEGVRSECSSVISGVPQGTVLGPLLFIIHIGDIDREIRSSVARSFADDTRITMSIKVPDDSLLLQEDLERVYDWAERNNMFFNGDKFKHMSYGCHPAGPSSYTTKNGSEIEKCSSLRDLGVIMESSAEFSDQIRQVALKGRQTAGWILRVFSTRDPSPLMVLYKSLVLPLLEYCSVLWSPRTVGLIRDIEGVQRSFTWRLSDMQNLSYWERLERLNLYSLERRRDRYCAIYIWKILSGLVPNINDGRCKIRAKQHIRRGRLCVVPPLNRDATTHIQTLRERSIAVYGPQLFNELPRELRNYNGELNTFKNRLDHFLCGIPDKPALPQYSQPAAGNSLLQQLAQLRAEQL